MSYKAIIKQNEIKKAGKNACFVYILLLDSKIYYTGITNNPTRRFKEHSKNQSNYTSKFNNKEFLLIYELPTRKDARRLEVKIKKCGAIRFIRRNLNSLIIDRNIRYLSNKLLNY